MASLKAPLPPPDNYTFQTLCRHMNVPLHPHEAHEALADVRATVGLYRALIAPANTGQSIGRVARQTMPSALAARAASQAVAVI